MEAETDGIRLPQGITRFAVIRSGGDVAAAGAEHGLCTACGKQRCGSNDKPVEIVAVRPFDELDCEAISRKADDAADAGADGQGHSHWRLNLCGHRSTRHRHVHYAAFSV